MRLIEMAYLLAQEDLKLNWNEIKGGHSNHLIIECYKAVDDLGVKETYWDDSEIPWCSCYVNKKIQDSGGRGTRSGLARSWLHWGRKTLPVEGCIVVLSRGEGGHVGFLHSMNGEKIFLIGGNQSNNVSLSGFSADRVLSYRTSND